MQRLFRLFRSCFGRILVLLAHVTCLVALILLTKNQTRKVEFMVNQACQRFNERRDWLFSTRIFWRRHLSLVRRWISPAPEYQLTTSPSWSRLPLFGTLIQNFLFMGQLQDQAVELLDAMADDHVADRVLRKQLNHIILLVVFFVITALISTVMLGMFLWDIISWRDWVPASRSATQDGTQATTNPDTQDGTQATTNPDTQDGTQANTNPETQEDTTQSQVPDTQDEAQSQVPDTQDEAQSQVSETQEGTQSQVPETQEDTKGSTRSSSTRSLWDTWISPFRTTETKDGSQSQVPETQEDTKGSTRSSTTFVNLRQLARSWIPPRIFPRFDKPSQNSEDIDMHGR